MKVEVHQRDAQGNVYRLAEPLYYVYDYGHRKGMLVVPVGFESDGASVPRLFWSTVFPPGDTRALFAAFVHDYIYRTHPLGWTRAEADETFRILLREHGVSAYVAWKAWLGVRIGGASAWREGGSEK